MYFPKREAFFEEMKTVGYPYYKVSETIAGKNHIVILATNAISIGEINPPQFHGAAPSSTLHVSAFNKEVEIIGLRMPCYNSDPKRRDYMDWIVSNASKAGGRPFIWIGDFNTDSRYSSHWYRNVTSSVSGGDRVEQMIQNGWSHIQPKTGGSWRTKEGIERCLDYAFVSSHFEILGTEYITSFGGKSIIGPSSGLLPDHAIFVVDLVLKKRDRL